MLSNGFLYLSMRVFLSTLIILVLVGCNSNSGEVAVEETTVEFVADTVQITVEEVDTIQNEIEEEDAMDRSKLLELYEVIEKARRQNDFSTIKKTEINVFKNWGIGTLKGLSNPSH